MIFCKVEASYRPWRNVAALLGSGNMFPGFPKVFCGFLYSAVLQTCNTADYENTNTRKLLAGVVVL